MKIRMVVDRTGGRWDGRPWPPRGGELYVEDEEGAAVCGAGWAVPVPEDPVEIPEAAAKVLEESRATPESAAEAPQDPDAVRPAQNAPKPAWVAYAATQGLPAAEAAGLSKAELVARYGS
jgi:hypothetical protein